MKNHCPPAARRPAPVVPGSGGSARFAAGFLLALLTAAAVSGCRRAQPIIPAAAVEPLSPDLELHLPPARGGPLGSADDLAVDAAGRLYIVDPHGQRICVFGPEGEFQFAFGQLGDGPGDLRFPNGIEFLPSGELAVADQGNGRVQVFDPSGRFLRQWEGISQPRGIAAAADRLYVADTGRDTVLAFAFDGRSLGELPVSASGGGQLRRPCGLAVAPGGELFIGDAGNARIVVCGPDGRFRREFALPGFGAEWRESYLHFDREGRLLVPDPYAGRGLIFDRQGTLVGAFAAGHGSLALNHPCAVCPAPDGRLYVSDLTSARVVRFPAPTIRPEGLIGGRPAGRLGRTSRTSGTGPAAPAAPLPDTGPAGARRWVGPARAIGVVAAALAALAGLVFALRRPLARLVRFLAAGGHRLPLPRSRWLVASIGVLALALATWAQVIAPREPAAAGGLFAAAGLLLAAFVRASRRTGRRDADLSGLGWPVVLAALIAIVAVAAVFRIYKLDSIPPGLHIDEGGVGLDAIEYRIGRREYSPYVGRFFGYPSGYSYFVAQPLVALLGSRLPPAAAVRLASALLGIATIPIFYLLGRRFYGPRIGLILALLLAVFRWHVTWSRIAVFYVPGPLTWAAFVLLFLLGLENHRWLYWAAAGLVLGLAPHGAMPSRMLPVGVVAIFGYLVLLDRSRLRRTWWRFGVLALAAAITFAPMAFDMIENRELHLARTRMVSVTTQIAREGSYKPLLNNLQMFAGMFHLVGDKEWRHNVAGAPMLDALIGPLATLGFLAALVTLRRLRSFYLLVWFVVGLLPGLLSENFDFLGPNSGRTILVMPVLLLLFGRGLAEVAGGAGRLFGRRGLAVVLAGAALLVAAEGVVSWDRYFRLQGTHGYWCENETEAGRLIARRGGEVGRIMTSQLYYHSFTAAYLAWPYYPPQCPDTKLQIYDDPGELPLTEDPGGPVLFLIEERRAELARRLRQVYPEARRLETPPVAQGDRLQAYELPREAVLMHMPAAPAAAGPGQSGNPSGEPDEPDEPTGPAAHRPLP